MGRTHFCCHVFVQGKPLFYDGYKPKPKIWWDNLATYQRTQFPIANIWYIHSNRDTAKLVLDSSSDDISNGGDSSSGIDDVLPSRKVTRNLFCKSDIKSAVLPQPSQRASKQKSQQGPNQNKCRFPLGVSMQPVSLRGSLPKCSACGQSIARGLLWIVKRKLTNVAWGYTTERSYHNQADCLVSLSNAERNSIKQ